MRRAQGSIVRHGDGWRVFATIHDETGKPHKKSKVVKGNRKEAEKKLQELLSEDYRIESKPFSVVCRMYLDEMDRRVSEGILEPRTVKEYRAHIEGRIVPFFGDMPSDQIKPMTVRRFLNSMERNRHAVFKTFRQICNWAERNSIISENVSKKVEPPKAGKLATRSDVYTVEEVREILAALENEDPPLQIAVSVALGCGLRRGEICGLDWSDYDGQRISITKAYGKSKPKTENSIRCVSVPTWTKSILDGFRSDGAMLSIDGQRIHPDTVTHSWERFIERAGLRRLPFKNLRHTSLTLAYEATIGENGEGNLYLVSLRAGHSNVGITAKYYSRPSSTADDRLGDALSNLY